jgi:hypothetical protein
MSPPSWAEIAAYVMLDSCSAYSWTLKIEATCSSETFVDFQQTTRRYIPEDKTLHNHRCENLNSSNGIYKAVEMSELSCIWGCHVGIIWWNRTVWSTVTYVSQEPSFSIFIFYLLRRRMQQAPPKHWCPSYKPTRRHIPQDRNFVGSKFRST